MPATGAVPVDAHAETHDIAATRQEIMYTLALQLVRVHVETQLSIKLGCVSCMPRVVVAVACLAGLACTCLALWHLRAGGPLKHACE